MSVDFAVTGQQEMDVFTGESIIMDIMDLYFGQKLRFEVKILMMS